MLFRSASADLELFTALAGTALAETTASGALDTAILLEGVGSSTSSGVGDLTGGAATSPPTTTGGGGGGRVGGAARVSSTRKLNELFEEIFAPTATVEQAVEKVEAAFKDKPRLEEVIAVIEEAERKAAVTATETAVRRAKAVAKRLENLRRELEAEEEAVVTLLLL